MTELTAEQTAPILKALARRLDKVRLVEMASPLQQVPPVHAGGQNIILQNKPYIAPYDPTNPDKTAQFMVALLTLGGLAEKQERLQNHIRIIIGIQRQMWLVQSDVVEFYMCLSEER